MTDDRRTAVVTVVTDDFADGAVVLLKTFRRHHPDTDCSIVVLHNPEVARLSPVSMNLLRSTEPNIEFREVDLAAYERIATQRDRVLKTPERLLAAFVIIDAFRLTDFDRVVCLDSDMLVLGPLDEILDSSAEFAAVTAVDEWTGEPRGYFNTGVMVIGRPHLTGETFHDIVSNTVMTSADRERGKADQAVLNRYFETRPHDRLAQKFNVTKRMVPDTAGPLDALLRQLDARILHFVGAKPWTVNWSERDWGYESAEALWIAEHLRGRLVAEVTSFFAARRTAILAGVGLVDAIPSGQ